MPGPRSFPFLFLAVAAIALVGGILWGPYYDGAIFGVIGEQLARGALPYRDAWDHKPPGIYVVVALLSYLPGPTWAWIWAASVGVLALTAELIRRLTWWLPALIALGCMGLWPIALGGGQTETFATVPAAAAFLAAARGRFVLAGILAGVSLTFSFQLLPLLVGLVVISRLKAQPLGSLALGGTLVATAVVVAFAVTGILPAAIDVLITYNRLYLGSDRSQDLPSAYQLALALLPLVVALPFRPIHFSNLERAALAWMLVAVVAIALQGRLLSHYAIPLGVPLAVLSAPALQRRRVAALALTLLVILSWATTAALAAFHTTHGGPATERVAAWIRANTEPTDRLLVWGADANIYLASERVPAGRYVYLFPLVTPGYTTTEMIAAWVADLRSEPPRIIVDSEAANSYWADDADFLRPPSPGAGGGRELDLLDPFRDFVRENYVFVIEIEGRKVYEHVAR
jgi:hypothetical protein